MLNSFSRQPVVGLAEVIMPVLIDISLTSSEYLLKTEALSYSDYLLISWPTLCFDSMIF